MEIKPRLWWTIVVVLLIALIVVYLDNRNLNKIIIMIDESQQRLEKNLQSIIDFDDLTGSGADSNMTSSGDAMDSNTGGNNNETTQDLSGETEISLSGLDGELSLEGTMPTENE